MGKYVDYWMACGRLNNLTYKIIQNSFGWLPQKDYDDFYSIATKVLWDCERKYSHSKKTEFKTYLIGCLNRKFKSQITYMNRKKRNSGTLDLSLEQLINDEDDTTVGDMVSSNEEAAISKEMEHYLDCLTDKQRKIATLIMEGFDAQTIQQKLHISKEKYNKQWDKMTSPKNIQKLPNRKV